MQSGCFFFDSDSRNSSDGAVGLYRDSLLDSLFLACFHEGPHFTRIFPVKKSLPMVAFLT